MTMSRRLRLIAWFLFLATLAAILFVSFAFFSPLPVQRASSSSHVLKAGALWKAIDSVAVELRNAPTRQRSLLVMRLHRRGPPTTSSGYGWESPSTVTRVL